ncbi:MAG: hypothetical protein ACM3NW_07965 [Syntrophomonadaceae bacterium]
MAFWRAEERVPPAPPGHLLSGVGSGEYFAVGERGLALLERLARLRSPDRTLDVGCGLGRLAWPLSRRLRRGDSCVGFDTALPYVECAGTAWVSIRRASASITPTSRTSL